MPAINSLDNFTTAYIECAIWSSTGNDGRPLDDDYGIDDLSPACLAQMVEDCKQFQDDHANDIEHDVEQAGHDFWLTRNHHGAGFWDEYWEQEEGRRLTEASHIWGAVDLYVGDDGLIYCS